VTGGGNDLLAGNGGSNRLDGGGGVDTVSYALADGPVTADLGANAASDNGAGGADDLLNIERLIGSAQGDTLTGSALANRLDGGGGEDVLSGGEGNDVYVVDDSDDAVTEAAKAGIDRVESSASFVLDANVENLDLTGRAAIDGTGNDGANIVIGNASGNRLDGGLGADTLRGGKGDDTYVVDEKGDRVLEERSGGFDTIASSIGYALGAGVEALVLTGGGAIDGTGNALENRIDGNAAANRIDGAAGADTMAGGLGDDSYVVDDRGDRIVELAGGGTDTVESSVSYALASGVNHLLLTGTAANGTGNEAGNAITGNDSGNILKGANGNDVLGGGGGGDRLHGGAGNDRLDGGDGSDGFYFDTRLSAASNVDRIVGFSVEADTIFVDRSVFKTIAAGTLDSAAFHTGAAAANAAHRIVYDAATGELFYDRDGSGAAAQILFARLDPGLAPTSADFVAFG
jgi:Ca2+-binding RTX toxin-like protein